MKGWRWSGVVDLHSKEHFPARETLLAAVRVLALLILLLGTPAISSAQSVIITEYPLGTPGFPIGITAGPDGAVWFTDFGDLSGTDGKIGRITTIGVITEYPLPTSRGGPPLEITAGPDGALWFTEASSSKIGRITTAGLITEFPTPPPFFGGNPLGIATGPDGALWFCEFSARMIGRITTSGVVTEYTLPTPAAGPVGITPGPDDALWFTEGIGKIGRITTAGTITEYLLPDPSSFPQGIVAGSDGALWFTERDGNRIGRITTSGVVTEYTLPTGAGTVGITSGPDGALWFTEGIGKIGRITTAGVITEYPLICCTGGLGGITLGPDGAVWFAVSSRVGGPATIGRVALPPTITSLTATPDVLWPPDHMMEAVSLAVSASDGSGTGPTCSITSVISNEPPAAGETDWIVTGPLTLNLRRERADSGQGRVYAIIVTCTNGSNLSASKTVTVNVPHDQR